MKHKSERYISLKITPWSEKFEKTTTQEFITKVTMEHYIQRHPKLSKTGEVELINSFTQKKCRTVALNFSSEMARLKNVSVITDVYTKLKIYHLTAKC